MEMVIKTISMKISKDFWWLFVPKMFEVEETPYSVFLGSNINNHNLIKTRCFRWNKWILDSKRIPIMKKRKLEPNLRKNWLIRVKSGIFWANFHNPRGKERVGNSFDGRVVFWGFLIFWYLLLLKSSCNRYFHFIYAIKMFFL